MSNSIRRILSAQKLSPRFGFVLMAVAMLVGKSFGLWVVNDFDTPNPYFPNGIEGWNTTTGHTDLDTSEAVLASSTLGTSGNSVHFSYALDGTEYPGAGIDFWTPNRLQFNLKGDTIRFRIKGTKPYDVTSVRVSFESSYGVGDTTVDSASARGVDFGFQIESKLTGIQQTVTIPATDLKLPTWLSSNGTSLTGGNAAQKAYAKWILDHRDSILAHAYSVKIWINGGANIYAEDGTSQDSLELDDLTLLHAMPPFTKLLKPFPDLKVAVGSPRRSIYLKSYISQATSYSVTVPVGDTLVTPTVVGDSLFLSFKGLVGAVDTVVVKGHNAVDSTIDTFLVAFPTIKILDTIAKVRVAEDQVKIDALNLKPYFQETTGKALSYFATSSDSGKIKVSVKDSMLQLALAPDSNGTGTITVSAQNGADTVSTTYQVTVVRQNDAPRRVLLMPDISIREDTGFVIINLAKAFNDLDGDRLTYSIANWDAALFDDLEVVNGDVELLAKRNAHGVDTLVVTASDGALVVTDTFVLTVQPVNDPPSRRGSLVSEAFVKANAPFVLNVATCFMDIDKEPLTYSVNLDAGSEDFITTTVVDSILTVLPIDGYAIGNAAKFSVVARDRSGLSATSNVVTVRVLRPTNDTPTVARTLPNLSVGEDTVLSPIKISGVFKDINVPEHLHYAAKSSDTNKVKVSIDSSTSDTTLKLVLVANANGPITMTLTATDDSGATRSTTFTVNIRSVNDTPIVIKQFDSIRVYAGEKISEIDLTKYFSDHDGIGDRLSFGVRSTNYVVDAYVRGQSSLSLDIIDGVSGADTITVYAQDGGYPGLFASTTFIVEVLPGNPPALKTPFADLRTKEDSSLLDIRVSGHFADTNSGDFLTYSVRSLAGKSSPTLRRAATDTTLSLNLVANANGRDSIEVTALDRSGNKALDTFALVIDPVNDAPRVLGAFANLVVPEDTSIQSLALLPHFIDVERDSLKFRVSVKGARSVAPLVRKVDDTTVYLDLSLVPDANGKDSITVTATDPSGDSVQSSFEIAVLPRNDAPVVVRAMADVAVGEDSTVSVINLAPYFKDVDGDRLAYTVVASDTTIAKAQLSSDSLLSIKLVANANGLDTFTVSAKDPSGATVVAKFVLNVAAVNDAPVALVRDTTISVNEDATVPGIDLAAFFKDVEGSKLAFAAVGTDTTVAKVGVSNDSILAITLVADAHGIDTIVVTATDPQGASARTKIVLKVAAVNDAPASLVASRIDTVLEDAMHPVVNLTPWFRDIDGDKLEYAWTQSNSALVEAKLTDSLLALSLKPDANGLDSITVTVKEPTGGTTSVLWILNVTPVNDRPVASDTSLTTDAGKSAELLLEGSDLDGTIATWVVSAKPDHGTAKIEAGKLVYVPEEGFAGTDSVIVRSIDNSGDTSNAAKVRLTVQPSILPGPPTPVRLRTSTRTNRNFAVNPTSVLPQAAIGTGRGELGLASRACQDPSRCETIDLMLPQAATVSVEIYDNLGTPVIRWNQSIGRTDLWALPLSADGRRIATVGWNLRAANGKAVGTGVYVWKLRVVEQDGTVSETYHRLGVK
ncbi:MAG: hypothetical protein RL173_2478 [Fibrobacterota bacterium]|jgi:hypothetical protein